MGEMFGKIAAPLANTGLDPVGKWTNKQLGATAPKPQTAPTVAAPAAAGPRTTSVAIAPTQSPEEEARRRRALAAGSTVLASANTEYFGG